MTALCSHCSAWRIHANDRFCGSCGKATLKVEVSLSPTTVFRDGNPDGFVTIGIASLAGSLAGSAFLWRKSAASAAEITIVDQDPGLPPPGAQKRYQIPFKAFGDFKNHCSEWQLIHRITPRKEFVVERLIVGELHPNVELGESTLLLNPERGERVDLSLVHRGGGLVHDARLALEVDEVWRGDLSLVEADESISLAAGQEKQVVLKLSSKLQDFLAQSPSGIRVRLVLQVADLAKPLRRDFRIHAYIPAKPLLEFENRDPLKALAGGMIHASVRISNRGGEGFDLPDFEAILSRADKIFLQRTLRLSTKRIESEQSQVCSITIPFESQAQSIPEGIYRFTLRPQSDLGAHSENLTATTSLNLLKRAAYQGIVAVDFGTTASAASCFNYLGEPTVIQLAEQQPYIPTAVCYYLDAQRKLSTAIGFEAQRIRDQHPGEVVYFDNLKWRLGLPDKFLLPNDATTRTFREVAIDYLREVRKAIENHPAVLAEVDQVCISQPARFDPRLSVILIEVFRAAGMEPQIIMDQPKLHAISESWPSAVLCIPSTPLAAWQRSLLEQIDVFHGDNPIGKSYLLLNFDMGGGSTDFSLMTLELKDYAQIEIAEVASDGDNEVAGNFLAELIAKHLDFDRARFPYRLPWKQAKVADQKLNQIMIENGFRLLDELIFPLQKDDGFLLASAGRFQHAIDPRKWTAPDLLNKVENERIQDEIDIEQADVMEQLAARKGDITVLDRHGFEQRLFFASGLEPIAFDFRRFIEDYIAKVSTRLYSRLRHLLSHAPAADRNFIFLITGRGGLFPLVRTMMDAYARVLSKNDGRQPFHPIRINGDHAKNVVSSGACYIKSFLADRDNRIVFRPMKPLHFGIIDGIDQASGDYLFKPIVSGAPQPEDGWIRCDYPCAPTMQELKIVFCYGHAESPVVKLADNFIGSVTARVKFDSPQSAKSAILLLRASESAIDVYLATPPAVPDVHDNLERWQRQPIGTLAV